MTATLASQCALEWNVTGQHLIQDKFWWDLAHNLFFLDDESQTII
jgi:hypothetical protein